MVSLRGDLAHRPEGARGPAFDDRASVFEGFDGGVVVGDDGLAEGDEVLLAQADPGLFEGADVGFGGELFRKRLRFPDAIDPELVDPGRLRLVSEETVCLMRVRDPDGLDGSLPQGVRFEAVVEDLNSPALARRAPEDVDHLGIFRGSLAELKANSMLPASANLSDCSGMASRSLETVESRYRP
jgi:hypothetical protein